MKDKLMKILKEFRIKCQNAKDCCDDELFKGLEAQAKSQILSLIRSCKPKKKDIEGRLIIDGLHRVYWDGFNSACDLMDKNIDDMEGL